MSSWGYILVLHTPKTLPVPWILPPSSGYWPPVNPPTPPIAISKSITAYPEVPAPPINDLFSKLTIVQHSDSLDKVIESYQDCFAYSSNQLGNLTWSEHKIDTNDAPPINNKPRRHSPEDRKIIISETGKLLEAGTVQPSQSPWSSNPLLVPKPDGSHRMCIDFRPLNDITVGDAYPMQRTDDIFDSLGQASVFSIVDLKAGFHQISVAPEDIKKTAFSAPIGQYEYRKMPFGLKNAPVTFQRIMDQILKGPAQHFTKVYLDDVIIYSKCLEDHLLHLQVVFQAFRDSNLKANAEK